ncbi:hypothetical protein [Legionella cardiaca]|uniref:Uncharacterized protein n=1 Tax=Legionella cardiaca TaxID=1071983 RepID=A0ABY8AVB6_9GAMM|nr:hypothetical protein [Legionella cardiaca]WED44384.1 hypothetical protein PXX05_06240 [Legionella cardiaca]
MTEEHVENDLAEWLSTYGLITVERILERYKIRLQQQDLISAIKSPNTFYHRLMRVPLKNVLNGIILQQAHDYQVYAQKLFIDYLLSGETSKSEGSPGEYTREDLEKERQELIKIGEEFHAQELAHGHLIADSQKSLIKLANDWQEALVTAAKNIKKSLQTRQISLSEEIIIQAINILLISQDFTKEANLSFKGENWARVEKITNQSFTDDIKEIFLEQITKLREFMSEVETTLITFIHKISDMAVSLREFRTKFYNLILKANDLIKLLPEYRIDQAQIDENRESLYFDTAIGEES